VLEFPLLASCLFFLHFLPSFNIFLFLWLFFAIGSIRQEAQAVKLNVVVLQTSQTAVVFYQVQVQLLAVLPDFSGFNYLLPTFKFNCWLYFRTSQASIVYFHFFKFNCNCTSGLLSLQSVSTILKSRRFYVSNQSFICLSKSNYFV
jgi:hypothetical protein